MASVNFFLRGSVPSKDQTIWLKFRDRNHDIRIGVKYLKCKLQEWKDGKCKITSKRMHPTDIDSINITLAKLQEKILQDYRNIKPHTDIKAWLKILIDEYFKGGVTSNYSSNLIEFIDIYRDLRSGKIAKRTDSKIGVLKSMLIKYTDSKNSPPVIEFKNLDNYFKDDVEKFFLANGYKHSTIYNKIKDIRTIAKFAKQYDIEVHPHLDSWKLGLTKFNKDNPPKVYLTLDELKIIENTEMPHEYLNNARDWLIISCYTGQRVGDFLRFEKSMINSRDNNLFIDFKQEKTQKLMSIPILSPIKRILNKRDGQFPRKISDVKYNKYIKDVCRICKINDITIGQICKVDDLRQRRGILDSYPKYKLVTSHIGRRSFATNFYGNIPTPLIMYMTGHVSESQFLVYINKTEIETADTVANIFKNIEL